MIAIEAVAGAAALVVIARLLTFRRHGRYRPGVAFSAWLVVVGATWVLFFGLPALLPARIAITVTLIALAVELINSGGNLAHLVRRPKGQK